MAWTREQEQIINARNCNLLVSAAAGSGKTAVLVERIVQMILEETNPINLDEMLVVTFTKAAASQMKERIETKLEEELEKQPANEHLLKQISSIHRAQITTIHSFCMDTVKNHFYKLSLDPNFRIGEEGELSLLKQEVLEEILEEQYKNPTEQFIALVESYAPGKNDRVIEEFILKIYEFCVSSPRPKRWLEEAKSGFLVESVEELEQSAWLKNLIKNAKKQLLECAKKMEYVISRIPDSGEKFRVILETEYNLIGEVFGAESYEQCRDILEKAQFKRWPTLTKKEKEEGLDASDFAEAKEIRDSSKKILFELREKFFFYGIKEQLKQIQEVGPTIVGLVDLVLQFYDCFQEKKREKNVFEFHDLEHFALELFVEEYEGETEFDLTAKPSEIALELRRQYREIFIDEYQDSNMVQELLLTTISKEKEEGNLFMVGDMKQSIYKFRMARPEIFQSKYERYKGGEGRDQKIELRNNFRSRKEVLEAANFIFYQTMQQDFSKMTYHEENKLVPSRGFADWNDDGNKTEILLLHLEKEEDVRDDEVDETEEDATKVELEAKMVAVKIRQLFDETKPFWVEGEDGKKRRATYRDIAILLRTVSGTAEVFEEVLTDAGIPVHLDSTKNSFHAIEIKTAVSLLEVIDNIYLDIPLVAVLRSPIAGVTAEELAMIRNLVVQEKRSDYSFYEYLEFYLESGEKETLKEKLRRFLSIIEELRKEKTYLSIEDLIWSSLKKTGYYQYVKGMPLGERRQANLDQLMQRAAKYEETSYRGLFQFIRYMKQIKNYEEEFGSSGLVEENAVKIMSIHKSKGLEFPIVFVSMLSKQFNYMDINQKLVLHSDYYLGVDKIDFIKREKTPTLQKRFLQDQLKLEMLQEELRVLYVALTRAKEKLILTAAIKDIKSYIKKPFGDVDYRKKGLSYLTMIRAKSYLDWIMPALCNEKSTDSLFTWCGVEKEENIFYTEEKEKLFYFTVQSPREIMGETVAKTLHQEITKEKLLHISWQGEESEKEKIYEQFRYEYPNQMAIEARGKWSVSELRSQIPENEEEEQIGELISFEEYEEGEEEEKKFVPTIPSFLREKEELVSTAKGTAIHKILELLDFREISNRESLENQLEILYQSGKIEEREWKAARRESLFSLWKSKIGERMRQAAICGKLYKEQQFMIGVPMSELEEMCESDELILIQGIIDLYFEEEDGIVIIDYKTDYIPIGKEEDWVKKYKRQILYYKKALEQITGKQVKETYLYAFSRRTLFQILHREEKFS